MKLVSKKASEKSKEKVFRRSNRLMHHVKVVYINIVFEEHFIRKYMHSAILLLMMKDHQPLVKSLNKVILPRICKLSDSSPDKKQEDQTQRSTLIRSNTLKTKMNLILSIIFTIAPINGSGCRVMGSSILDEILDDLRMFFVQCRKKH